MTIQALVMLSKLKKTQIDEDRTVYIDKEDLSLCTVQEGTAPYVEISVKNWVHSLDSVLSHLERQNLIIMDDPLREYVRLTHDGWHIWQTAISRFLWFLFSSIFVPIVVSALTAIITLWIAGWS